MPFLLGGPDHSELPSPWYVDTEVKSIRIWVTGNCMMSGPGTIESGGIIEMLWSMPVYMHVHVHERQMFFYEIGQHNNNMVISILAA
jgi:hypothetical protein